MMKQRHAAPTSFQTSHDYVAHLDSLHDADEIESQLQPGAEKRKTDDDVDDPAYRIPKKPRVEGKRKRKPCKHCNKYHAATEDECWENPDNANERGERNYPNAIKRNTATATNAMTRAMAKEKERGR